MSRSRATECVSAHGENSVQRVAASFGWIEHLARLGWVARGISYVLLGLITFGLATGDSAIGTGAEDADQAGALRVVAGLPAANVLLSAFAAGLLLFALWQAIQLTGIDGTELDDWIERGAKVIGVVFYGWLVFTSITLVSSQPEESSQSLLDQWSGPVLGHPIGRIAVAATGLVIGLIAIRRARRTVTGDFGDELDLGGAPKRVARAIEVLGRVGEVGRATSFLLIAWFLVRAGVAGRPSDAGGLDRSLARAASGEIGSKLVMITAAGFLVFGLFSTASARWRVLDTDRLERFTDRVALKT